MAHVQFDMLPPNPASLDGKVKSHGSVSSRLANCPLLMVAPAPSQISWTMRSLSLDVETSASVLLRKTRCQHF